MGERKFYSKKFKEEAVLLAEKSSNITQVAQQLGIHQTFYGDVDKNYQGMEKKLFLAKAMSKIRK